MATSHLRRWATAATIGLAALCQHAAFAADDAGAWGEASNGVRCRVVAIDPKSDDEAPDLTRTVASFASGDEVTLGVELQNVSDKPVTLLGVHLSQDWGSDSGKFAAEEFGPHLFEFELMDGNGEQIARTRREYAHGNSFDVLLGASAHELSPGQSLIVALRPAKFDFPMDYALPPGEHRVRVRYRPTTEAARLEWAKRRPDDAQSRAWTGSVVSNEVSFSVATGRRRAVADELVWGESKDGLRAAIELRRRDNGVAVGESFKTGSSLDVVLLVQNVAVKPVPLLTEWLTADVLTVRESSKAIDGRWGGAMAVTGMPRIIQWTLQPGEMAEISRVRTELMTIPSLAVMPPSEREWGEHYLGVEPGRYVIRYSIGQFGGMQAGTPLKELRGGLITGETPLVVR